jgi:hypothetical protein
MTIPRRFGWTLFILACVCGRAADLEQTAPLRCGVRLTTCSPRQDFRSITSRTGLGGGVFVEAPTGPGWIAQTRFDYLRIPQTNHPDPTLIPAYSTPDPITLNVDSASLGVDLRHPVADTGPFARVSGLAGASLVRYEFQTSAANTTVDQNGLPIPGIIRYKDKTSVKIALAVGVNVDLWRGLALTGRYTTVDINGVTFATLETSLSYRF